MSEEGGGRGRGGGGGGGGGGKESEGEGGRGGGRSEEGKKERERPREGRGREGGGGKERGGRKEEVRGRGLLKCSWSNRSSQAGLPVQRCVGMHRSCECSLPHPIAHTHSLSPGQPSSGETCTGLPVKHVHVSFRNREGEGGGGGGGGEGVEGRHELPCMHIYMYIILLGYEAAKTQAPPPQRLNTPLVIARAHK